MNKKELEGIEVQGSHICMSPAFIDMTFGFRSVDETESNIKTDANNQKEFGLKEIPGMHSFKFNK